MPNNNTTARGTTWPWLAHYPTHVAPKLGRLSGGLPQLLEEASALYPWRPYTVFTHSVLTYDEVLHRAHTFAAALQALKLPAQSRIGICLPNSPAYIVAFWGTLLAGHVVVNMNPLLTPSELAHELNDSDAAVLITFNLNPTFAKIQQAVRQSRVPHIWVHELADDMEGLVGFAYRALKIAQRQHYLPNYGQQKWAWLGDKLGQAPFFTPLKLKPELLAVLQYTGGTTGTPKAATLSHGNLLANARQVQNWLGPTHPQGETLMAVLPLFHVFALTSVLLLGTATASKLVLMPQFNLGTLVSLMKRYRPTLLSGVPTLFQALATHPKAAGLSFEGLRFCICGGAPLPLATREAFAKRTNAALVEGYGLSEASPVLACGPSVGHAPLGSVGYPLPSTVVEIHDPKTPHNKLSVGAVGEIWAKGPQVMHSYWRNPKATKGVFYNGWLRTGDMGYLDDTGALFVVDRLKDMIIVNGYKVYPRQIEEVLLQHPSVAEAVVVAMPHARLGEAPMGFVVLNPNTANGTNALEIIQAWANARLNKLSQLAALEAREVLPKTLVGKHSRKELTAEVRARAAKSR
jgi:long-chain acyl-CoA synthetase